MWHSKLGGIDPHMLRRRKDLKEEDRRLKVIYAKKSTKVEIRQGVVEEKHKSHLNDKR